MESDRGLLTGVAKVEGQNKVDWEQSGTALMLLLQEHKRQRARLRRVRGEGQRVAYGAGDGRGAEGCSWGW